ncbi:MAG: class I SAM-dependent methyltransferase [Lachnospiraceae bacterium]|nr:class I SAM-dependent methyltransferase [Lachnospiraceae bacterium]MDE6980489.1 class I SAM-dependent methyltransferase [Lachnospiraceae bacterium]
MVRLSKRLSLLSHMVTEGHVLADVGTDHGYIPIYLVKQGKIPKAIAMDIRQGPLLRAREHIGEYDLGGYIETRLSDGVASLHEGEADTILIAGMGGGVILHILKEGKNVIESTEELVLQPQSEMEKVREYLFQMGYGITGENMLFEDGKFYQMLSCRPGGEKISVPNPVLCRYGERLLLERHPVLREYLFYRKNQYESILDKLMSRQDNAGIIDRKEQIGLELAYIREALTYWR